MKTLATLLSALAIVGAASAATAAPDTEEFGSRAFWEQLNQN